MIRENRQRTRLMINVLPNLSAAYWHVSNKVVTSHSRQFVKINAFIIIVLYLNVSFYFIWLLQYIPILMQYINFIYLFQSGLTRTPSNRHSLFYFDNLIVKNLCNLYHRIKRVYTTLFLNPLSAYFRWDIFKLIYIPQIRPCITMQQYWRC